LAASAFDQAVAQGLVARAAREVGHGLERALGIVALADVVGAQVGQEGGKGGGVGLLALGGHPFHGLGLASEFPEEGLDVGLGRLDGSGRHENHQQGRDQGLCHPHG